MKPYTFEIDGKTCIALVRKLTELEVFRLMGVSGDDANKIIDIISKSACYKLAGNSIVVNVLAALFYKMFIDRGNHEQQLSLFGSTENVPTETYDHEHPLRVFTLCSGYGSQELALEWLKQNYPPFDYRIVGWAEFDPESSTPLDQQPAVKAYKALHPEAAELNHGDMTKIDWDNVEDFDLLFYSTPCQSISQAGLQHGFVEGSGTRSSIIWNVRDAIRVKKPKYACLENVAAMVSQKFLPMFNVWRDELYRIGYSNFAKLINAKNCGMPSPVPQNRERVFLVSILDPEHEVTYNFPETSRLEIALKDVLDDVTDVKYYLHPRKIQDFIKKNIVKIEEYAKSSDEHIEVLPQELREWIESIPEEEDSELENAPLLMPCEDGTVSFDDEEN